MIKKNNNNQDEVLKNLLHMSDSLKSLSTGNHPEILQGFLSNLLKVIPAIEQAALFVNGNSSYFYPLTSSSEISGNILKNAFYRFPTLWKSLYDPIHHGKSWLNDSVFPFNSTRSIRKELKTRCPLLYRDLKFFFGYLEDKGYTHCLPVISNIKTNSILVIKIDPELSSTEETLLRLCCSKLTISLSQLDISTKASLTQEQRPSDSGAPYDLNRVASPRTIKISETQSLLYVSSEMERLLDLSSMVARTDRSVLLLGESGTGKELIASYIHNESKMDGPFIALNCAAIPQSLMEDELFGHESGSFTGASRRHIGRFEASNNGTLFLDEIGEMPLPLQAGLLRVLQERLFRRVGGETMLKWTGRLILATNRNLEQMVKEKSFREDLYYRINVVTVNLPPLRKRKDDIIPLIKYYIDEHAASMNKNISGITEEARRLLLRYNWPGNVRELENTISRAVLTCQNKYLSIEDFPSTIMESISSNRQEKTVLDISGINSYSDYMRDREIELLHNALKLSDGNKTVAAKLLKMNRNTFTYRVKQLGMF